MPVYPGHRQDTAIRIFDSEVKAVGLFGRNGVEQIGKERYGVCGVPPSDCFLACLDRVYQHRHAIYIGVECNRGALHLFDGLCIGLLLEGMARRVIADRDGRDQQSARRRNDVQDELLRQGPRHGVTSEASAPPGSGAASWRR